MKKPFSFLRHFLYNYISALLIIFSIYSVPCIFLAILGVLQLLKFHLFPAFFISVFSAFFLILFLILTFRFFRLPLITTNQQEKNARSEVSNFIKTFPFSYLDFQNPRTIFSAILELNSRIARSFGVRSAHPELDIPVGYLLHVVRSISTDLEDFLLHNAVVKNSFFESQYIKSLIGEFDPLHFIKLYHILKFIPKQTAEPRKESFLTSKFGSFLPKFKLPDSTKVLIFQFLFQRIAHYSIQLYTGKILVKSHHFTFRNSLSFREFFKTRLLLWPILCIFFLLVLFVGLIISGLFYSTGSVHELVQLYRNCQTNGLTSFSTLPWGQIFFRLLPGILALIFSCIFYFIFSFFHFHLTPIKVQPVPEWPNREHENFHQTKQFIDSLKISRLGTFSSILDVARELLSITDSLYTKPGSPSFSLSLSEMLKAQQILISRLQTKFDDEFPFMNFLHVRDFLFINSVSKFYFKFYNLFRRFNYCVNPFSGTVLEARIRLNKNLIQSLTEEFLFTSKIFLLDLISFHLIEIYSGHLHFPDSGLPLSFFLTCGTNEQDSSISTSLRKILNKNLSIKLEPPQENSTIQKWLQNWIQSDSQSKLMEERMRQSDFILFFVPEKTDSARMEKFQEILVSSACLFDATERAPIAILVVPATRLSFPCSGNFLVLPWQSDDETVFQEAFAALLSKNHSDVHFRQTFRFLREYKEKYSR